MRVKLTRRSFRHQKQKKVTYLCDFFLFLVRGGEKLTNQI